MTNSAVQCRAMGLNVGDTIEGTESGPGWWSTTRLTLLWVGDEIAVWRETSRCSLRPYWPEWSEPREVSNWTLRWRDWRKVLTIMTPHDYDTNLLPKRLRDMAETGFLLAIDRTTLHHAAEVIECLSNPTRATRRSTSAAEDE